MEKIVGRLVGSADKFSDKQITETIDVLLQYGVRHGASDIHIEPLDHLVLVRYRIDGLLRGVHKLPRAGAAALALQLKKRADLSPKLRTVPQEGRFLADIAGRTYAVRVTTMPIINGEKIVLHLTAQDETTRSLQELGFWGDALGTLQDALRATQGLVIVAGPTHAGKAATLRALLGLLNNPTVSIATIEDPLEYRLPGVNHASVQPALGMTFPLALAATLKQDPNVVMLSAMPDAETIERAVDAAHRGHLIVAGLHADSATQALLHVRALGSPLFLLQHTVRAVVGQRLVRRLCVHCRQRVELTAAQQTELEQAFGVTTRTAHGHVHKLELQAAREGLAASPEHNSTPRYITHLWQRSPDGCSACDRSGFKGRIALVEVMTLSPAVQRALTSVTTPAQLQTTALKDGFIPLKLDGLTKALCGLTTVDEVLRV